MTRAPATALLLVVAAGLVVAGCMEGFMDSAGSKAMNAHGHLATLTSPAEESP